jgi:sphinganine-1-phosphate aldolase
MAKKNIPTPFAFPAKGRSKEEVSSLMQDARVNDARWKEGRTFSLVFYGGEDVVTVTQKAYLDFYQENGLNLGAFPSLKKFDNEVVAMSAALMHGDEHVVGNMTSGGTESILCAVKTAKTWAKKAKPEVKQPEIIVPVSAHPAFDKACDYFGIKLVHVKVHNDDKRADVAAMEQAINQNTIMIVGSAPAYPHGVIDPIEELAQVALKHGVLFHVDACVGGFMLPFVEKLGYKLPLFDFRVKGVTSISMDCHKYGYAAKGASVVLYKDSELRKNQYFVYTEWTGGIYASPSVTGTRPGGAIAAAWAVMNYLGEEGYLKIARKVMDATDRIRKEVNEIEGLEIVADPHMSVLAIGSTGKLDVFQVGDEMSIRGWHIDKQQDPDTLHLTISNGNVPAVDEFLKDLKESVKKAKQFSLEKMGGQIAVGIVKGAAKVLNERQMSKLTLAASKWGGGAGLPKRTAAMYGMIGALPNEGDINSILLNMLDGMHKIEQED